MTTIHALALLASLGAGQAPASECLSVAKAEQIEGHEVRLSIEILLIGLEEAPIQVRQLGCESAAYILVYDNDAASEGLVASRPSLTLAHHKLDHVADRAFATVSGEVGLMRYPASIKEPPVVVLYIESVSATWSEPN